MFKQLSLALLASSLIACGSDSSDDDNDVNGTVGSGAGISSEINSALKGPAEAPQLSTINGGLSDGSTMPLNTVLNTSIASNARIQFSYTSPEDQTLIVILDGDDTNDSDLELSVSDNQTSLPHTGETEGANEVVVFKAEAGTTYTIEIESLSSFEISYSLTLVTGNRASLELADDEYAVTLKDVENVVCTDSEGNQTPETGESISTSIMNFKQGYSRSAFDTEKSVADSASNNTLFFKETYEESLENFSTVGSSESQITVDPNTGALTGSEKDSSEDTYNGETESCTSNMTATGNILL